MPSNIYPSCAIFEIEQIKTLRVFNLLSLKNSVFNLLSLKKSILPAL